MKEKEDADQDCICAVSSEMNVENMELGELCSEVTNEREGYSPMHSFSHYSFVCLFNVYVLRIVHSTWYYVFPCHTSGAKSSHSKTVS